MKHRAMDRRPHQPLPFLPARLLPDGFQYPRAFREFANSRLSASLLDGDPWTFFDAEFGTIWAEKTQQQNKSLTIVPFAIRQGTNHVACFDGACQDGNPRVILVRYDSGTEDGGLEAYIGVAFDVPGWFSRGFEGWLDLVADDRADFKRWKEE
jgi:hypothetical protein